MPSSAVQTCALDRKSTRLNSSHTLISYAVFCLKKNTLPVARDFVSFSRPFKLFSWLAGLRAARPPRLLLLSASDRPALVVGRLRCFFFNDPATPEIYTLSLHDALPISRCPRAGPRPAHPRGRRRARPRRRPRG